MEAQEKYGNFLGSRAEFNQTIHCVSQPIMTESIFQGSNADRVYETGSAHPEITTKKSL